MKSLLKKPVLLFFPMDMLSHHLRCLQLADAIKSFATCIFATEKYSDLINSRNYEAVYCTSLSSEMIIQMGQKNDSSWVSTKVFEPVLESQIQVIKKIKPHFVVNDYSFTAHLAAEYLSIPCLSLINGLFSNQLAIQKPIPLSHPMARFSFLIPEFVINGVQNIIFKMLHRPYRQIRKKLGLSLKNRTFMDEFKGDISLILDTNEFAPQTHLPPNTFFLGPIYHTDSKVEEAVLSRLDPNKKTLMVNMGSSGSVQQVRFLNDLHFSKYNVLVVGSHTDSLDAPHIIKEKFLSLESVLPKVDLVFSQGGTGNIFQSLAHGVPVFCYPTFFEQDWNSLRVQELGYGLNLTSKEPLDNMRDLVESWSCKKEETKFKLLCESINVEKTKYRFQQIIQNLIQPKNVQVFIAQKSIPSSFTSNTIKPFLT